MAREINWDEPLSEEDRAWAEQRPDMPAGNGMTVRERIVANDEQFGKEAKDAKKSRAERMDDLRSTIADAENELTRLQLEQDEEDRRNAALDGSPDDQARGLGVVDNTSVDGEAPEGAPEAAPDYDDEHYWTKARLQQEIESRNPDREREGLSPLSKSGNRSELIERLRDDDREMAEG